MPLAPMGCASQIHKNSDKRGTWQYHSVDGWYLYTSPYHYRTHACHIKTTKKEQLTDTVDFQHKRITNPTITHADKVMHAIQQVIREIKKLGGIDNSQEARDLQQLVNGANNYLQSTELLNTQPVPRVNHTQHSIGSERQSDDHEMKQSLPRVSQSTTRDKMPHNNVPPASRTRSKTANIRIENAAATREKGQLRCNMQRLLKRIEQMENELHEALEVMDAETGKVLNYRQLMQSRNIKKHGVNHQQTNLEG
jgi:hypothetical protein